MNCIEVHDLSGVSCRCPGIILQIFFFFLIIDFLHFGKTKIFSPHINPLIADICVENNKFWKSLD